MDQEIRLWIVAADPYVRASLTAIIEDFPGCQVSGQGDPQSALAIIEEDQPANEIDLLIWDFGWVAGNLEMPYFRDLDIPVVLLLEDKTYAAQAWASGG